MYETSCSCCGLESSDTYCMSCADAGCSSGTTAKCDIDEIVYVDVGELMRHARYLFSEPIDRVAYVYEYCESYHSGQGSWEYELLCRLGRVYKPAGL